MKLKISFQENSKEELVKVQLHFILQIQINQKNKF